MKSKNKKLPILIAVLLLITVLFAIVGCNSSELMDAKIKRTQYDIVKQTKTDNFTLLNAGAKLDQVVLVGDSIIELFPTELYNGEPKLVYNRGISGDTTNRMFERFQNNVLNIQPSKILILTGTNDLKYGFDATFTIEYLTKCYDLTKANSPNSQIIISSVYPVNKDINKSMVGSRTNAAIIEINRQLKQFCSENDSVYADVASVLTDVKGEFISSYTYDGLHPNANGYIQIANYLRSYLFE